jgi:hypothetical protein
MVSPHSAIEIGIGQNYGGVLTGTFLVVEADAGCACSARKLR